MNKLICILFGHKWKYNFRNMPNKAICSRCKSKIILDLVKLEWNFTDSFKNEKRPDNELCETWH